MSIADMTKEEKLEEFTRELADFMGHVVTTYKGLEKDAALTMACSFAAYVSIAAKKPKEALESFANVIRGYDFSTIRAEHFGYTLGAHETQKKTIDTTPAAIVHMGEFRPKR